MTAIPFNKPTVTGRELEYISQALGAKARQGGGTFTQRCHEWLETWLPGSRAFLTQSCTSALEMAALLAGIKAGDEVVMPSYTFASTANAFVQRGAIPVFVDVCLDTLCIDPAAVESAITDQTRAIVVVHYAGFGCDMEKICAIAERRGLVVIEDAAQAIRATLGGRPLGSYGALAAFSFHDSKNISSGEGGALIVNRRDLIGRAEIAWEKGTNRSQFARNEVAKYTWVDVGSSFLPSETTAAFLLAQLESAEQITERRRHIWNRYHAEIEIGASGVRKANPPEDCYINGHIYFLIMRDRDSRDRFIGRMAAQDITTPFHYVPLHSSPAGSRFGRTSGSLANTDAAGDRLIRLPLFASLTDEEVTRVIRGVNRELRDIETRPEHPRPT